MRGTGVKDKDEGEPQSFEAALAALEAITTQVESGTLPLSEALDRFEAGIGLAKRCREELERAEGRIQKLVDSGALEPFELKDG